MKNIIVLLLIVGAGYAGYRYLYLPSSNETSQEANSSDTNFNVSVFVPDTPTQCRQQEKDLENGIYGSDSGRVSFAQRNTAYRTFKSCLRHEGFTDAEVDGKVAAIEERVKGYLKQDGSAW